MKLENNARLNDENPCGSGVSDGCFSGAANHNSSAFTASAEKKSKEKCLYERMQSIKGFFRGKSKE